LRTKEKEMEELQQVSLQLQEKYKMQSDLLSGLDNDMKQMQNEMQQKDKYFSEKIRTPVPAGSSSSFPWKKKVLR